MQKKTAKVRVYLDLFFFTLMVLVLIPQSTGIPVHEWASFIILIPFVIHLIINWDWIVTNSSKFFQQRKHKNRFDYLLNWLLYVFMLIVTVSGIVISEAALPFVGIHFTPDPFWTKLHNGSATLFMIILGVHLALHWKWIKGSLKKFKFKSDLHHLSLINNIVKSRTKPLIILVSISVLLSLLIWGLDYSDWAKEVRLNTPETVGEKQRNFAQSWLIYVLPLVKVSVLFTIPALLTGAIIRLKKIIWKKLM